MEALGVMVEVILYLVVDGVLESRPGLLHLPSPGLWHRWRGVHAVSPRFTQEPITALGVKFRYSLNG